MIPFLKSPPLTLLIQSVKARGKEGPSSRESVVTESVPDLSTGPIPKDINKNLPPHPGLAPLQPPPRLVPRACPIIRISQRLKLKDRLEQAKAQAEAIKQAEIESSVLLRELKSIEEELARPKNTPAAPTYHLPPSDILPPCKANNPWIEGPRVCIMEDGYYVCPNTAIKDYLTINKNCQFEKREVHR